MKRKLFICGGHVTPAIATIDILTRDKNIDIVFIGRKYAMEGDRHISAEYTLIQEKSVRFLPIIAGRLQRTFSVQTIPSLLKIPAGFIQAVRYCLTEHPVLIVSFGGYVALPVALAGWLLHIPVITHEQTLAPGLANRIIERIATRVCVTFDETLQKFTKEKTIVTGLPMREELFSPSKTAPYVMETKKYPLLYITGGSTGAHTLNRLLFPVIGELVKKYTVIHQTGSFSHDAAVAIRSALPENARARYIIESFTTLPQLSWILGHAFFVIGRSGANTTMELSALGKVAILVPLPWSAGNEQLLQAKWLAIHGGAVVVEQNTLTSTTVLKHIQEVEKSYDELHKRAEVFAPSIPRDGAARLAQEIQNRFKSLS